MTIAIALIIVNKATRRRTDDANHGNTRKQGDGAINHNSLVNGGKRCCICSSRFGCLSCCFYF